MLFFSGVGFIRRELPDKTGSDFRRRSLPAKTLFNWLTLAWLHQSGHGMISSITDGDRTSGIGMPILGLCRRPVCALAHIAGGAPACFRTG